MTSIDALELEALEAGVSGILWHVTLTVAGRPVPTIEISSGLERLEQEHPFLLAGRYASDRAEVRYWEESPDATVVTALALRLWQEHQLSAMLPDWQVVGIEVIDRDTFHRRAAAVISSRSMAPLVLPGVTPF